MAGYQGAPPCTAPTPHPGGNAIAARFTDAGRLCASRGSRAQGHPVTGGQSGADPEQQIPDCERRTSKAPATAPQLARSPRTPLGKSPRQTGNGPREGSRCRGHTGPGFLLPPRAPRPADTRGTRGGPGRRLPSSVAAAALSLSPRPRRAWRALGLLLPLLCGPGGSFTHSPHGSRGHAQPPHGLLLRVPAEPSPVRSHSPAFPASRVPLLVLPRLPSEPTVVTGRGLAPGPPLPGSLPDHLHPQHGWPSHSFRAGPGPTHPGREEPRRAPERGLPKVRMNE